ncbi:hypothetical protein F7725_013831 [Dissostichus mawsoni]|uniref:Uncharacterized protein n=1 Tax=Dissostichus mawsoni TaxID=36200 RepID=A0A7J5YVB5_DISMA|nr:hypothetical protein F7725_013831 [Dissostichus mawsoni]
MSDEEKFNDDERRGKVQRDDEPEETFNTYNRLISSIKTAAAGGFPPLKLAGAQATLSWKTAEMAAVWMLLCVLTVCLARGIYLFDNCVEDEGIMFDLAACFLSTVSGFPADLSPNEISLKKAFALFQSMEFMLDQDAGEVQLETNEVKAEASRHQNVRHDGVNETENFRHDGVNETENVRHDGVNETENVRHDGVNETENVRHDGVNETENVRHDGVNETRTFATTGSTRRINGERSPRRGQRDGTFATTGSTRRERSPRRVNETENVRHDGVNETENVRHDGVNETENVRHDGVNETENVRHDGSTRRERSPRRVNETENVRHDGVNETERSPRRGQRDGSSPRRVNETDNVRHDGINETENVRHDGSTRRRTFATTGSTRRRTFATTGPTRRRLSRTYYKTVPTRRRLSRTYSNDGPRDGESGEQRQSVLISSSCWRFPSFKAGWCSGNTLLENCSDGSCLDAPLCADCMYLFDNCVEDEGIMFDLTACFLSTVSGFPAELSPNEISLKKAFALFQAMESMLERDAGEVLLDTHKVDEPLNGTMSDEES